MTFEARDSAAKVVPARFKLSTNLPPPSMCSHAAHSGHSNHGNYSRHGSLKTSGVQTSQHTHNHSHMQKHFHCHSSNADRRALTQSFMHFSRGLALETQKKNLLKVPQGSINRSPSAPDLVTQRPAVTEQSSSPLLGPKTYKTGAKPKTFAACALLNPDLLHRHAVSVDETTATYRLSNESLHRNGSQGSMAMDLHLEYPVTLRIKDRRRNPLRRQRRIEDEANSNGDNLRRSSHSYSPKISPNFIRDGTTKGGSAHQLTTQNTRSSSVKRRSSNASDCTSRSRSRRRESCHARRYLERAVSSDSKLTGAIPKYYHQHSSGQTSIEQEPGGSSSDTDVRPTVVVFCPQKQ